MGLVDGGCRREGETVLDDIIIRGTVDHVRAAKKVSGKWSRKGDLTGNKWRGAIEGLILRDKEHSTVLCTLESSDRASDSSDLISATNDRESFNVEMRSKLSDGQSETQRFLPRSGRPSHLSTRGSTGEA
ncbi:hypothetical protein RHMOL_Rhmol02G0275900 [Rhododendron molle]|uniref:Uncharacterized protein n=1 Tax=Rhododendron molle TaxID=49168 RepID=A0ACC0PX91_RHOML|nr:hypothetical protein RHMOL_Rhmol02G0275900 [Rhododendron molle]